MKKTTLLFISLISFLGFAQQKSTGTVTFFTGLSANLLLDNSLSKATLTITGPSDRWFAVTIGSFAAPGAMTSGNDIVYYNGTTLIDATHNGQGNTPSVDAINNWTVTGNTVASGVRTLTATRPFIAEATDFTFNYSNTNISLAGAHAATAISNALQYHGGGNRANLGSVPLTVLGVEDFSLRATQIYPNPSNGEFLVKTKTALEKINVYTQTGAFVKTIEVKDASDAVDVNVKGLQTGVYLIELVNNNEKSWKKIIVN
jgi:hypothetical protein